MTIARKAHALRRNPLRRAALPGRPARVAPLSTARATHSDQPLPQIPPQRRTLSGAQLFARSLTVFGILGGAVLLAQRMGDGQEAPKTPARDRREKKWPDFGQVPLADINARLNENAREVLRAPDSGPSPVAGFATCAVASNAPIEDYHVEDWFQGRQLFGVFDGHAGRDCGALLTQYLTSYVAHELIAAREATSGPGYDVGAVGKALQRAFVRLDGDIVGGGVALPRPTGPQVDAAVDAQTRGLAQRVASGLSGALAGSCALAALVDGPHLYVACTGDSRAVLGRVGALGKVEAVALSTDQTASNTSELRRMLEAHPGEEKTVIRRNRVLGGLMPTRAFGDARYKWPASVQQTLFSFVPSRRKVPDAYLTPPYVTAEPVVVHHALAPEDQFLVLASDGVWDELSNEEVVGLVESHRQLEKHRRAHPDDPFPAVAYDRGRFEWAYVDANPATHIVRNALGGQDVERAGRLLAMPYPTSRSFRDDMTVTVVYFDNAQVSTPPPYVPASPGSWWSRATSWAFSADSSVDSAAPEPGYRLVDLSRARVKTHRLDEWISQLERERVRLEPR